MKFQSLAVLACVLGLQLTALAQTDCDPQRLLPDPAGRIGDFGSAIAMNDRHLIIGDRHDSRYCTVDPDCSNGMVYAYEKDADGQWVLMQEVEPADLGPRFGFGSAVALSGEWMVATAAGEFAGASGGAAYFFKFDGERWIERQSFTNPRDCHDCFGFTAAMHGSLSIVQGGHAPLRSPGASVYHFDGESWQLVQTVGSPDAPSTAAGFGHALAIDDERVVVGAQLERSIVTNGGAAYVFRREPDGTLAFEQKLIAPDVLEGPRFGAAVAIEGGTLIVGGTLSDHLREERGAVYVYELRAEEWELRQVFSHEDADLSARFGDQLALDGDLLLVGAQADRTPMAIGPSGTAYLFRRDTAGLWQPSIQLPPTEFDGGLSQYGDEVAMSHGSLAIGASNTFVDGAYRGAAYAYDVLCILCRPDLDADGALTIFDFLTFLNLFQDGDLQADFDGDGELTIFDFLAFQTAFDAGCE